MDTDTFLTTLYVLVADFCNAKLAPDVHPGPPASLSRAEVVTLAGFSQWERFPSERGFYRWARRHLRGAFPGLPDYSQFNRLVRRYSAATVACFLALAEQLGAAASPYQARDSCAVVTRDANRRGAGWLAGEADVGWHNHYNSWYEGLRLLAAVGPAGGVCGYGGGPAPVTDQRLAETFLAQRAAAPPRLASAGAGTGLYLADKGFGGASWRGHWQRDYRVAVVTPPKRNSHQPWPKELRRLASLRQMVETVFEKLYHSFRLAGERPHLLAGLLGRLAAKMALHNFCIYLNRLLGRPDLAFADLIAW